MGSSRVSLRFPVKNRVTAILARFAPSPRAAKRKMKNRRMASKVYSGGTSQGVSLPVLIFWAGS